MKKRKVSLLTGMFLMGVLLVGHGITGNYLFGYRFDACESGSECGEDEVCCLFYDEDYGICDKEENCKGILQVSMDERQKGTLVEDVEGKEFIASEVGLYRSPAAKSRNYSFSAGLILLVLFVLVFMWDTGKNMRKKRG